MSTTPENAYWYKDSAGYEGRLFASNDEEAKRRAGVQLNLSHSTSNFRPVVGELYLDRMDGSTTEIWRERID